MYAEIDVRGKAAPESNWATSQIYSNRDRCAQNTMSVPSQSRPVRDVCFCEGFRMTADRDDAACTGAVVRKPPMKETALGERVAVPRALIYRGLTLAAAVICEHNFCVMARTLLTVENSFASSVISKSYVWQK
jgi:hypothetical protein